LAVKVAVVGLGKMGVSHFAIANALSHFEVLAVCDASPLVTAGVQRVSNVRAVSRFEDILDLPELEAVIIATPTALHQPMIERAIERGLHLFCEKPLTLSADASEALATRAEQAGLVTQVGYHNRFVGTFIEFKRLLDAGVIGPVRHFLAEAYGPVVTKPAKPTWRGKKGEGGGALLDYAAHPLNLLNWYAGATERCDAALQRSVFSSGVEDEVYAQLAFASGASAQLSVNWSDSSHRKMTTRITAWGEGGKIYADRQELQLFQNGALPIPEGLTEGWNVRYTTELTAPVSFYLRGEEYSAQLEEFAANVEARRTASRNDFRQSAQTDRAIDLIEKAAGGAVAPAPKAQARPARRGFLAGAFGRSG
jgi:scyllo-inositol 2-dehydrogenase (NADP+)